MRRNSGAKNSSCSGEYVRANVVHVKLKKTRLRDVDHDESIGIANNDASGRLIGTSSDDSDIFC